MLFRFVPLSLSVREKNMQPVRFAVLLLRSLQTKRSPSKHLKISGCIYSKKYV